MVRWQSLLLAVLCCLVACSDETPAKRPSAAQARVGDCYAGSSAAAVDCNSRHVAQTVFVGDGSPPADEATALAPCREALGDFLGQDFHTRLGVELWTASDTSWYRCDVLLRNSTRAGQGYQVLTGSLEGVLRRGTSIDLQACLNAAYDPTVDQTYVSCRKPHVARELTVAPAIGTLEEAFPDDVTKRATNACNATASAEGQLLPDRLVTAYFPKDAAAWTSGERTADCWVTATKGTLPGLTSGPGMR